MATSTPTTTKAPTIPALTSDAGYAKALAQHHKLGGTLVDLRVKQRLLESEASKLAAASLDRAADDHAHAVNAFLADMDVDAIDPRQTLAADLADLRKRIDVVADGVKKHFNEHVAPALGAAQRRLAPVAFEQVWKPTMRKAVEQMVAFHRHWAEVVLPLAEQIGDAGLWVSPMSHPIDQERATARDHFDAAANVLRESVSQGYHTAAEARGLLPGVKI